MIGQPAASGNATPSGGKIAAALDYAFAVKADGSLWTWGNNHKGQLGNGATVELRTPTHVMDGVVAVEMGSSFTLLAYADGSLWSVGDNDSGQLGNGSTQEYSALPVQVAGGDGDPYFIIDMAED